MSYAYLFKYIIIGDTGKGGHGVNKLCFEKLVKLTFMRLANRCWEILPPTAIYGQTISARS